MGVFCLLVALLLPVMALGKDVWKGGDCPEYESSVDPTNLSLLIDGGARVYAAMEPTWGEPFTCVQLSPSGITGFNNGDEFSDGGDWDNSLSSETDMSFGYKEMKDNLLGNSREGQSETYYLVDKVGDFYVVKNCQKVFIGHWERTFIMVDYTFDPNDYDQNCVLETLKTELDLEDDLKYKGIC